ncbi:hypothetical protein ACFSSC_11370 [Corynebacterium mendelii]|uniref:Uncharacterized protein n=1 Tax=Corynebacterium mendelii TaxID=2765362 RepID=A0A939DZE7_9CORY|nr:hypothetical protein [Corynebacterium mendelii]MBN9643650.1 hypothetical protein [Corynebacterium mendelii]
MDNDKTSGHLEHWTIDHPGIGPLDFIAGPRDLLAAIDPGWYLDDDGNTLHKNGSDGSDGEGQEGPSATIDAAELERLDNRTREMREQGAKEETNRKKDVKSLGKTVLSRLSDGLSRGFIVVCDGKVVHRAKEVTGGREQILKHVAAGYGSELNVLLGKDKRLCWLQIDKRADREILAVFVRQEKKDPWVAMSAPEGSVGAKRIAAMESSPLKAFLLPVVVGLGKTGWLIALLVLGPLLAAAIRWLRSLFPDFHITWPSITIPWPDITIPWPDIQWPKITIPWPDIHIPFPDISGWPVWNWLDWLDDHSLLKPLLMAIVVGTIAFRRYRRSAKAKKRWNKSTTEAVGKSDPSRKPQVDSPPDNGNATSRGPEETSDQHRQPFRPDEC